MGYYCLEDKYELCGWDETPFALRDAESGRVEFYDKETYRTVYACDGHHDIDENALTERQKEIFQKLKDGGAIFPALNGEKISGHQEYQRYPGVYRQNVMWSITGRCNSKCRHCFMSAPEYCGEDLSMADSIKILDELYRCGIRFVSLTGGEALYSEHFWDILAEMKKRNMGCPVVYSNGLLFTDELIGRFKGIEMYPSFQFSFDGVGWHDWLRGIPGAEKAVIHAFEICQRNHIPFSVSMCLHRHNIGTVDETIDLLSGYGCRSIKMNVTTPSGSWANEKEHFISWADAYEVMMDYVPKFARKAKKPTVQFCLGFAYDREQNSWSIPMERYPDDESSKRRPSCRAMKSGMYIGPEGRLLPCMSISGTAAEKLYPSLLETHMEDILKDSFYKTTSCLTMGECIDHNEQCHDCKYRYICGAGCRACACEDNGDFYGVQEEVCFLYRNGYFERFSAIIDEIKQQANAGKMN